MKKHLLAYLLPNLAQLISSFGTVAILTRFLSGAEYGRFGLVFTAATLLYYVFLTWAEAAAGRFYARARETNNTSNHFATLLTAFVINCALFFVLSVLVLVFYQTDKATHMAIAAAFSGAMVRSLLKIGLETRRMDLQSMRYASIESLHIMLGFILTAFGVIVLEMKQDGPFVATLIAAIIALCFEIPSILKHSKGGKVQSQLVGEYLHYGFGIAIALILTTILNNGDRFVIAAILGEAKVGAYTAGYQVAARILDIVFFWAASVTFPLLVNAYESGNKEEFNRAAMNSFSLKLAVGAPAAFGIALVSAPLCEILIGPELRKDAIYIAPFIAFGALLLGLSEYFSDAFLLAKKVGQRVILLIFPTLLNIALNFMLLPKMGINGAIVSTIISYGAGLLLFAFIGRRYIVMPIPWKEIGKISIAICAMSIAVGLVPKFGGFAELILKAIIGAIVYTLMAIWLNFAQSRELISKFLKKGRGQNIGN